jgi:chromate reductase, NAD(P)H dehydrogenase (quinone)
LAENLRILGISGSLRKASYNTAALKAAAELAPEGVTIELADLSAIPMYNPDLEAAGLPQAVLAFKAQIEQADAVWFAMPEYNFSISGVLKNALDWVSRPSSGTPLNGKPAAIMGATGGVLGTARSQYHLRQIGVGLNILFLNKPEVFIARVQDKFDATGKLGDDTTRQMIEAQLKALVDWTRRLGK